MTSFFFAWRYLRSKKSTNAINIIAWISMVAIGVVTAALVVVLSVFNGFEDLVRQMYGDFYADLQMVPASGKWVRLSEEQIEKIKKIEGVISAETVLQERAILLDDEDKSIVWLKGVTENYGSHSGIPGHMLRGEFYVGDSLNPRLVLGAGVEQSLQIVAGQSPMPVTVYLPNREAGPGADPASAMLSANAFAAGSFAVQQEFDEQFAFTHVAFLRYMLGLSGQDFSSLEIFIQSGFSSEKIKNEISKIAGEGYTIKTKFEQNQGLFSAMKTEKLIIYAVSFLILVIAGFNIVSSLTMTVIEKQKDIAVLKAMGANDALVYSIFLYLGILLAGVGAVAGFLIGLLICLGQEHFHWVKLGGQSFIIDYYPVAVRLSDMGVVATIVITMALLSAWMPSRRATETYYSLR
ncbi:MAG: FtsX-like permease family protein [Chitinophagaceae bacterium]|nr:FtsX-like permease family protein [Chitinophagaceae bacterium]